MMASRNRHEIGLISRDLDNLSSPKPSSKQVTMADKYQQVIQEYIRACEAVLKLDKLSESEEEVVGKMLVRLSYKVYPD